MKSIPCWRFAAWLAFALPLSESGVAHAQADLPALLAPAPAPYPEGLRNSGTRGTVELTLEVDGTGRVLDVVVLLGGNGMLERAALASARDLRFSTGRRGRQSGGFSAVVAYVFEDERFARPRLISVFFPQSVSVTTQASPPRESAPVATRVSAEEARRVPGTQGDAVKVVENLPGVARAGLGSGDVVLWGAAPSESRVLIDGIEVPTLFHLGGLRSVVASPLLAAVEVVPGAYGVSHGRGLGGLVRVETASLPSGLHGGASVNPLDATVHLGVSTRGGRLRVAGAWREGLLHRILDTDATGRPGRLLSVPAIRDQQLKVSATVDDDEEVQALVLASHDGLERSAASVDPAATRREVFDRGFVRAAVRYLRYPGEDGEEGWKDGSAEAVLWLGSETNGRDLLFGSVPARLQVATRSVGLHAQVREGLGPRGWSSTFLVMGVDGLVARSRLQRAGSLTVPAREGDAGVFGQPPGEDVNADDWRATAVTFAPFVSAELDVGRLKGSAGIRLEALGLEVSRVTPRVGATPGIGDRRLDWAADPRAALSYGPLPWLRLMASGGRYHQLPSPEDLSAVFGTPILDAARGDHLALGGSVRAGEAFVAEATAFARRLSGLSARDPSGTPPLAHVLTGAGRGGSTGAQMLLRWSREQGFSGWLAYTLSRSSRRDQPDLAARPADFDQTNVLAAVAGYRRGAWSFGSRGRWATGAPRTPVVGSIYDARADRHAPLFGAVNSMRLAPFFQLDLRAERGFAFRQASLDLYLELLNVTARRNAEELAYNFDYSARETITGLPFLAVAGARLRF